VGNNIVNIGASALATALAIAHFGSAGVGIATGAMTLAILIFSETTPKSLAARNPEGVAVKVVSLLWVFSSILRPIAVVIMFVSNLIIKLLGGTNKNQQQLITEEEMKTMITMGHEEGVLEGEEKKMIHNVFEFGATRVTDVMTPRTFMVALDKNATYAQIVDVFKTNRFSRIPVYDGNIDNIVGILFLKDLFLVGLEEGDFDILSALKRPYFTIEYRLTTELFREMRDEAIQMAIVVDEYGGTAGIITIEDLVEEIVGEIYDESDQITDDYEVINEKEFLIIGTAKIDTVNELLGTNIYSADFDSIGGFIFGQYGRLPEEGESVDYKGVTFVVEKVYKNRIERLRVIV
jgi:putative hemolysin